MIAPDAPEPEILNCMETIQIVKVETRRWLRATKEATAAVDNFCASIARLHVHLAIHGGAQSAPPAN